jgi:bifunctional non-homologous end joining protein LigD
MRKRPSSPRKDKKGRKTRGAARSAASRADGGRRATPARPRRLSKSQAASGIGRPSAESKLLAYRRKRDPSKTSEPFEAGAGDGFFVVQKHDATRLHYDFRLAMDGVLVSWAVPKGPSYDTRQKRLAVHVEDHPLSYRDFEGVIPEGEYGAGSVIVWDAGPYRLREGSVASGSLKLDLSGKKLRGGWALVRMKPRGDKDEWLLIKERDEHADAERDVTAEEPGSILSGLTIEEIAARRGVRQWNSGLRKKVEELPSGAAREGRLPRNPEFMKAKLVAKPPVGGDWLFEIKLDGVRAFAIRESGKVRLVTRNRKEVAFRYPEVVAGLERIPGDDFVLDGEIVAFDEEGRTRFELLQGRIHLTGQDRIAEAARATPAFYYAFDVLYAEGHRLEEVPLEERKQVLARLLRNVPDPIRYSDHVRGKGSEFFDLACGRGLEGVIGKRADAPYRGTRSGDWVKVKCLGRQEFMIGGYTPPQGGRAHFGALLLGVYDDGRLSYVGKVGTGFSEETLADIHRRLKKLERATSPFAEPPREKGVRWVSPELVAEVRFTEWTSDGRLRHPAFVGLREDKDPREVVRELPTRSVPDPSRDGKRGGSARSRGNGGSAAKESRAQSGADERRPSRSRAKPISKPSSTRGRGKANRAAPPARVEITNPDKVFYPKSGITKGEVADYYAKVSGVLLPYLEERPLTLVRFPNGIMAPSFFQKDQPDWLPAWIPTVRIRSQEAKRDVNYLLCNDAATLAYVANLGAIDLHPWASRVAALEQPDYVVWDLDPPEAGFRKAADVAPRVREVLERAGLSPFLKTSGGKGLHLYVPLVPENGHDQVRDFAEVVARMVVEANPRTTTLERSKKGRGGKVYVDYLQNGRGKTVVAPYSLRAKEPATVSMPITWREFEKGAEPRDFTLRTVPGLVSRRGEAWRGFRDDPARLADAVERLAGRGPARPRAATGARETVARKRTRPRAR